MSDDIEKNENIEEENKENITDENNLDKEGELYLELGRLLTIKRSKENNEIIKNIISSKLDLDEKIKKINELDSAANKGSGLHLLRKKREKKKGKKEVKNNLDIFNSEEVSYKLLDRGYFTPLTNKEKRKYLKSYIKEISFFNFFFQEFKQITRFAQRTHVIEYKYFLPGIKMSRNIENYFQKIIQKNADQLIHYLKQIEAEGWEVLTKFEYNLIMELKKLCEKILLINMESSRAGDVGILNKLRRLENGFFVCHFQKSYPEKIIDAINHYLKYKYENSNTITTINNLVKDLLYPKQNGSSLHAIIVGLNIVANKKMVILDDLINRETKGIINNCFYECPGKSQITIDHLIVEKVKRLKLLLKQKREIDNIKKYLKYDMDNKFSFAILDKFYTLSKELEPLEPLTDENNIINFITPFCECFLISFEEFMSGKIQLITGKKVKIFSPDYFKNQLIELEHLMNKFNKLKPTLTHINLTRERLLAMINSLLNNQVVKSKAEIEAVMQIKDLSNILKNIGRSFANIYQKSFNNKTQTKEIELLDIKKNIINIPYNDIKIVSKNILNNETVKNAFHIIISVCYTAAIFLHNQELSSRLNFESKVKMEIKKIMESLERLADPLEFDRIKEEYKPEL